MKKAALLVMALILVVMTACTQVIFLPIPGGNDDTSTVDNQNDSTAMINYLQSEGFLDKVASGYPGLTVNKTVSGTGGSTGALMRSTRAAGDSYLATITFRTFSDPDAGISIASGSMEMEFHGIETTEGFRITSADVDVTEELSYTANGRTGTFSISYENGVASGTISASGSSFEFTSSITVSAPSNATITANGETIQWNEDMGSQITNGFGGGSGTPNDPYRIYNEEQFIYISKMVPSMISSADGFYYYDVLADLEFTDDMASPILPFFRGDLDFNGHSLRGITEKLTGNMTEEQRYYIDDSEYIDLPGRDSGLIINFISGTIRNLEYYPGDSSSMLTVYGNLPVQKVINNKAQKIGDSISFENVNIYGDFSTEQTNGSNMSYYIAIPYMCTLSFKDCENHASFNVNYGGAFVGGYLGVVNDGAIPCYVNFDGCTNYGNISGTQVGVLIGSHNNIAVLKNVTDIRVTAKNCHNEGIITGTKGAGFYGPAETGIPDMTQYAWFDSSEMNTNTGDDPEHIIVLAEATNVEVSLGEDDEIIIQNSNPEYASFMIQGSTYSRIIEADGSDGGTWIIYRQVSDIPASKQNTGLRKLKIIDSTNPSITDEVLATMTEDSNGYKIISINNVDYYYHDSLSDNGQTRYIVGYPTALEAELTWNLICYNAEGYIVGSKTISF